MINKKHCQRHYGPSLGRALTALTNLYILPILHIFHILYILHIMHILQREAPFEMFWLYMGIAQIALDPPPHSIKRANVEKSAPNRPGKPLHPQAK